MPSHLQQSVPFFHDVVRLPSCESPARNWRRELLSCSVQELAGEAKKRSRTIAKAREIVGNLLLYLFGEDWSGSMLSRPQDMNIGERGISCALRSHRSIFVSDGEKA